METSSATAAISAWKPAVPGVREVLHGDFGEHAYPPHTHDTWTLFVVDAGSIRYDLDRTARGADPAMVSVLPPFVVHDGRPATTRGYRTRVVYLEPEVIGEARIGPAVDAPVLPDARLRTAVSRLHDDLACADEALSAETHLAFIAERIRELLGEQSVERAPTPDLAERARAILDARLFEPVTMESLAAALGTGRTQVARAFSAAYGIAPHAYVVGRRLDAARDRILDGRPLADVAAEVGFYDQAHLTRRFRRFLGTTPGRFARAIEARVDG
jgi:AraC-like DNA-binding protein